MTTAASGFRPAPRAGSRLETVQRWAIAAWAVAFVAMGLGLWAVQRDDGPKTYYVVKRLDSGRCTVMTAPPENGESKTLWFSTMQRSALAKVRELKREQSCG